ncbi:hypothetical protein AVEN_162218-1 [Araneus ventricosus]|uniref:Uncharacterized protein n=1 Tax=Araneus ventricosus TaxID=182803 RepID=A0A4Y2EZR2_ARAVE|nr:hypothetical protein AVEN_162218-1 [Araneus ventricosus]
MGILAENRLFNVFGYLKEKRTTEITPFTEYNEQQIHKEHKPRVNHKGTFPEYNVSKAIKSGNCKEDFAVRDPGPLSHSRWLTTANRTLRLYLSEESSTPELQEIVVFILKSYMPLWFSIKTSKYFTEGPRLVYKPIKSSRYLPEDLRNIADPVIERNGFFAHTEHLMLAMTQDNTKHIRELGLRRILKARQIKREQLSEQCCHKNSISRLKTTQK